MLSTLAYLFLVLEYVVAPPAPRVCPTIQRLASAACEPGAERELEVANDADEDANAIGLAAKDDNDDDIEHENDYNIYKNL